jgi:hypothetical protein
VQTWSFIFAHVQLHVCAQGKSNFFARVFTFLQTRNYTCGHVIFYIRTSGITSVVRREFIFTHVYLYYCTCGIHGCSHVDKPLCTLGIKFFHTWYYKTAQVKIHVWIRGFIFSQTWNYTCVYT